MDADEMSRMYSYVRARQLEGSYSPDPAPGNWIISDMRIRRGWGSPSEKEWPYDGDAANWPPKEEPPDIDELDHRFHETDRL
jgi:C1A family cysteine protease